MVIHTYNVAYIYHKSYSSAFPSDPNNLIFVITISLIASLLKLVTSQRLIRGKDGKLVLVPEVMVVDNIISGIIRKEKLSVSEIEDAIQSGSANGSIGLINSIAELFVNDVITLDQAKAQIEEKNIEILNRTIMQLKIKKGNNGTHMGY